MKRAILAAAALLLLASCGGNAQKKTATAVATIRQPAKMTTEQIAGAYYGTLPAADCPGIETTLTLRADGTYTEQSRYIDRDAEFVEHGTYAVGGELVTLNPSKDGQVTYLRIEPNALRMLDSDRQPVEGALAEHYVLTRKTE